MLEREIWFFWQKWQKSVQKLKRQSSMEIKIMPLRCQLGAKSHVGSEIDFTRAGYNCIYETTPTVAFKRKNINLTRRKCIT